MSDLISRKKICDYIKGKINPYGKPFEGTAYELGLKIIKYIDAMDSAYNVDKVVEELELHSFELGTDTLLVHYVRLNEAIEIVKKGGVSDCNVVDMHLCDTCKKTYPECDGKNVKFGCDIDTYPNTRQNKDNIFYCDGYVKREKKKTNADHVVKQGGIRKDV